MLAICPVCILALGPMSPVCRGHRRLCSSHCFQGLRARPVCVLACAIRRKDAPQPLNEDFAKDLTQAWRQADGSQVLHA